MPFFKKRIKKEEKPEEAKSYELPSLPELPPIKLPSLEFPEIKTKEVEFPETFTPPLRRELTREIETGQEIPPVRTAEMGEIRKPEMRRTESEIFVKIDRFKEALASFETIKRKLSEIENLLKKTKDIQIKEKEELDKWESEFKEIKEKIDTIDSKLFSKLD